MSECPWDPWPMRVITKDEAEWCYEQRRFGKRSLNAIAAELGQAKRSVARAIAYIALERKTYGEAWAEERREHRRNGRRWFLATVSERDRLDKIAKQPAEEHLAVVALTRAALDSPPPRETRAERERRIEREMMSGRVPIVIQASGNTLGNERAGRVPGGPLSTSEREARRRARRLREMLGPNPMPHELGL